MFLEVIVEGNRFWIGIIVDFDENFKFMFKENIWISYFNCGYFMFYDNG